MPILNLTSADATPEQAADGVCEPDDRAYVRATLAPDHRLGHRDRSLRATALALVAKQAGATHAMIEDGPLTPDLDAALMAVGITPLRSYMVRDPIPVRQPDGSERWTMETRHVGWIERSCPNDYPGRVIPTFPNAIGRRLLA